LQKFFETGTKAGIQPKHASRLSLQLERLDDSSGPKDMDVAGWKLHELKANLAGIWAVWVSGNWRLTFMFQGTDAVLVNYEDYH
jgi:proteic killer suppression protein